MAEKAEKQRISKWPPYDRPPKGILKSMIRETSHIPFYMYHGTGPLQDGVRFNKFFNVKRWSNHEHHKCNHDDDEETTCV